MKDASGKPLLTVNNPKAAQSQLLRDRVHPGFDFTKPQKLTRSVLTNSRIPVQVSEALRKELGAAYDDQLDHQIALQLSGSNQRTNLALVPGRTTRGEVFKLDQLGNQLARRVIKGEMSLLAAQRQLAKAKGRTLTEDLPGQAPLTPSKPLPAMPERKPAPAPGFSLPKLGKNRLSDPETAAPEAGDAFRKTGGAIRDFGAGIVADPATTKDDPRSGSAREMTPYALGAAAGMLGPFDDIAKAPGAVKRIVSKVPAAADKAFDAAKYVAESVAKRERARGVGPKLVERAGSFLKNAKTKLVDFAAPIEDVLADTLKKTKVVLKPSEHITNQIDRVLRAPTIAGQFVRDGGLEKVIKDAPDLDALDQYLIARHARTVTANGVKTGRDIEKDARLIEALAPEYEAIAKTVTEYSRKLLDYSVDSGLISKQLAAKLREAYPDYVPLNRIFEEGELVDHGFGGGKAVASLSRQTVVQKLSGSEREIASPLESLIAKTNDAFRQGEKNKAARILASYKDLPGNPFQITPLRTAENVTKRIDLYSEAKELRPLQDRIDRFIKSRSHDLRRLESEINRLNKQGLHASLKGAAPEFPATPVSAIRITRKPATADAVRFGANDQLLERLPGNPPSASAKDASFAVPSATDVKKFVNALFTDPNADLDLIKKKIATRENKLGPLLDTLSTLRKNFDEVRSYRSELLDEARLLSDAKSRGKSTFSAFNDGIKEIYETTPEVADAAKALNVQQLNILGKILALPVRVAKLGITGINIPFVASNIAKDQVTGFINSNKALQTSIANPLNFVRALFSAVKHDDLYQELVREGAGGTSFDIARDQIPATIDRIRASRSVAGRALYTVKHPSQLLRAAEDIIGRSEELTRLQQYRGTREALIKQGMSPAEAKIAAAKAARENTVNFARRGEWGTVLNSAFLYLNAGIQGTRTLVRSAATRPLQTGAKIATTVFLPVSVATAWNMSDPNRRKAYEDIAEFEKENNIIIVPPDPVQDDRGRWNVIKIPLAQGVNSLATVPRRALEQAFGLDDVRAREIAQSLVATVSPIAPTKGAALSSLTPQAIKPTLEQASNMNFFTGRPIVPHGMTKKPAEEQVFEETSGAARRIGKRFNMSPLKVESFIRETFGGVGSQALNALDRALAAGRLIPKDQIGGESTFEATVRRFRKATGGETERRANRK
jgi:Large polyvalent protein associated domain 38